MATWKDVENMTPERFSYLSRNERIEYLRKMQTVFQSRLKQFARKDAPYSFSMGQFVTYYKTRGKKGLNYKKYMENPTSYNFAQLSHVYASLYNPLSKESGSVARAKSMITDIADKQFKIPLRDLQRLKTMTIEERKKFMKEYDLTEEEFYALASMTRLQQKDYTTQQIRKLKDYFELIDQFKETNPIEYESKNYYNITLISKIISDTGRTIDSTTLADMAKTLDYYDFVEKHGVSLGRVYDAVRTGEWADLYKRVTGMDWYEPV